MLKQIPEKLIDYSVYKDGTLQLGTATVTLPTLEAMSETITGAGILGEIESITPGHFSAIPVTLTFRTITPEAMQLLNPGAHTLDFRGSQQMYDVATGNQVYQGVRVTVKAPNKSFSLGNFEPHSVTDTSVEMTVNYIKIEVDGKVLFELDKLNGKYVTNGTDHYATIRKQLGM